MLTIKSQAYPTEKRVGDEINLYLEDLEKYSDRELATARKFAFMFMQMKRFTREELKLLVGHTDWMLRQRKLVPREPDALHEGDEILRSCQSDGNATDAEIEITD